MKHKAGNTWVKVTQHNFDHVKTSFTKNKNTGDWKCVERHVPVDQYMELSFDIETCIVVTMKSELYVEGRAYNAMIRLPDAATGVFKTKDKTRIHEQIINIKEHDTVLYARLKGSRPPLPRGCKTFLLELFAGAMILTQVVVEAGYTVSEPADYARDGIDLLESHGRKMIED